MEMSLRFLLKLKKMADINGKNCSLLSSSNLIMSKGVVKTSCVNDLRGEKHWITTGYEQEKDKKNINTVYVHTKHCINTQV